MGDEVLGVTVAHDEPTDAIVRVVLSCVYGSDLWYYRGESPFAPGPIGHEFIGVVEDIGSDVHSITRVALRITGLAGEQYDAAQRHRLLL